MLVQINYDISFSAPFHLGTGISAGMIDRTVIRDAQGYLYVPASTFKGVLREQCERLCRIYLPDAPQQAISPHDAEAVLAEFNGIPTIISRIFGSSLHPGELRFSDAKQRENYEQRNARELYIQAQTSVATQVRIDRLTRTAADEALYTSEFGVDYLTFTGTIKGQLNCTPIDALARTTYEQKTVTPSYSLLLLLAGLMMIERLGGNKSTGKGECTCRIIGLWLDKNLCREDYWQYWLDNLTLLSDYPRNKEGEQA